MTAEESPPNAQGQRRLKTDRPLRNSTAAAYVLGVKSEGKVPERRLQEFRGCVGLVEFDLQPGRGWGRGSEEGC